MLITINKNTDQFFIALAKANVHSFVLVGVYNQFKVKHLLSRVGKVFQTGNVQEDNCLDSCMLPYKLLSSGASARLKDEGASKKWRSKRLTNYQAYDISYQQYLEYIRILKSLSTGENKFFCYQPSSESEAEFSFMHGPVLQQDASNADVEKIKDSVSNLSVHNTCRHSAITLVEFVQKAPVASLASTYFFYDLPYETNLEYGKPSPEIPFYVLPAPPVLYSDLGAQKHKILEKLYKRMEHMLLLEPNSQSTMDKFTILKNLYNDIVGEKKEFSLNQLLVSIQSWKQDNLPILSTLRKKYIWDCLFFTRTSATMNLVNQIESELKSSINSLDPMRRGF